MHLQNFTILGRYKLHEATNGMVPILCQRMRKGGITTTIKLAIKLTIKLKIIAEPKQNANEGCNSCASLAWLVLSFSFIVSFIVSFTVVVISS